jgi:ribosomal-protein-alanine N-acetyltransferase
MLPTLTTPRLELRPATIHDLDVLLAIWSEPDVRRFLFDDEPVTREHAAEILHDSMQAANAGLGLWVALLREGNIIIGCVGLLAASTAAQYDPALEGAIEPLAAFAPPLWGRGYVTEALTRLIDYAFGQLDLQRLAAVSDVPNQASQRLIERLGFKERTECEGPRHRLRVYELTRPQFLQPL